MEPNPYEPPRTEIPPVFSDSPSHVTDLERRVAELERRVSKSWLLRPNFLSRIVAVWGYLILGYLMIVAIVYPLVMLLDWLFHLPHS